jgi:hypothetical protein
VASLANPAKARAYFTPVLGAAFANDIAKVPFDDMAKNKEAETSLRNDVIDQKVVSVSSAKGDVTVEWCVVSTTVQTAKGQPSGGSTWGWSGSLRLVATSAGLIPDVFARDSSTCASPRSDPTIAPLLVDLVNRYNEVTRNVERQPELAGTSFPTVMTGSELTDRLKLATDAVQKKTVWVGTDDEWKVAGTLFNPKAVLLPDGRNQILFCQVIGGYLTNNGVQDPKTIGVAETESYGIAVRKDGKWLFTYVGTTDKIGCSRS